MERKFTIAEETLYKEDYQMRMIKANELEGILRMGGRGVNGSSCYDYDISGKISMKAMFERSKIRSEDIKMFLKSFKIAVREVEAFLLNIHCLLLDPEYIFYEDERYFFCYYPLAKQDLWEVFHGLTEYFVKQADYQDPECVRITFLLHKKTMEENYSLEKLTAKCLEEEEGQETETLSLELAKEEDDDLEQEKKEEDTLFHNWPAEQEMGADVMRGPESLWSPVKRFLNKHKKPKWGDWDGLHIEEEDL